MSTAVLVLRQEGGVRGLKRLILGLVLLALVMTAVAFWLPQHVTVQRTAVIDAPESDVFPYLNSFRKFNQWSPWAARDPNARYEFSGPEEGEGARMAWSSDNPDVGKGSQEIVGSVRNKAVHVKLDFGAQGKADATYELTPAGAGTRVTWGFETNVGNNPMSRWVGLLFDRWIGADYEQGLANLKKVVEAKGPAR